MSGLNVIVRSQQLEALPRRDSADVLSLTLSIDAFPPLSYFTIHLKKG